MSTQTSKLPNSNDKTKTKTFQLFSNHICNAASPQDVHEIWEQRKKFNLKLIEEYKKEECLWNVNSEKFLIFMLKKPAWERIAANMGKDVTVDLVKNRIFIMRCQMQEEAAKVKHTKTVAIPDSKYYFAKHFLFLDEMLAKRKLLREKKPFTVNAKVEDNKSIDKRKPQSLKPLVALTKNKSTLSNASTATLVSPMNSKGEKSPRSFAGRETFASTSLLSTDSGEESSSSSISSLSSNNSNKSVNKWVNKSSLNSESSPRSRISSTTGDESTLCPTWYTTPSPAPSTSSKSMKSAKFDQGYPWQPLKFKTKSSLLKSSFKVAFKRPKKPKIQTKEEEPTKSSTDMMTLKKSTTSITSLKSIKSKRVQPSSLESSPRESLYPPISKLQNGKTSELEKKLSSRIELKRQENLLNFPNPSKSGIMTFSEKIEEDDKKFFDKIFEISEAKKQEKEMTSKTLDRQLGTPNVYYKLENFFKSINSPVASIIENLNHQNSEQIRKDFFSRGVFSNPY